MKIVIANEGEVLMSEHIWRVVTFYDKYEQLTYTDVNEKQLKVLVKANGLRWKQVKLSLERITLPSSVHTLCFDMDQISRDFFHSIAWYERKLDKLREQLIVIRRENDAITSKMEKLLEEIDG